MSKHKRLKRLAGRADGSPISAENLVREILEEKRNLAEGLKHLSEENTGLKEEILELVERNKRLERGLAELGRTRWLYNF